MAKHGKTMLPLPNFAAVAVFAFLPPPPLEIFPSLLTLLAASPAKNVSSFNSKMQSFILKLFYRFVGCMKFFLDWGTIR